MIKISLIIPTRNEEKIITKNLTIVSNYMRQLHDVDDYEIIICDKSEDSTPLIVKELSSRDHKIRYCKVEKKGIGAGLKSGIDAANFEFVMLYDIDMAWQVDIIEKAIRELLLGYDIVYGSRYADGSDTKRPLKRKIFSIGYRILVRILFGVKIKDWNANRALRKSSIMKFRDKLKDNTGFFHTELVIHGRQYNLRMKEIPAKVNDLRNSSISFVIKVALCVLKSSLKKRIMLWIE